MTVFETYGRPDSATLEHVYSRAHPRRPYACNHERGAPSARALEVCPVVQIERKIKAEG